MRHNRMPLVKVLRGPIQAVGCMRMGRTGGFGRKEHRIVVGLGEEIGKIVTLWKL